MNLIILSDASSLDEDFDPDDEISLSKLLEILSAGVFEK